MNDRKMLRAVCDVCNCKKNKFIKKQKSKGIIAVNCQCIFKYFVLNVKTEILKNQDHGLRKL